MKKILLVTCLILSLLNIGWFSVYKIEIRDTRNFYTYVELKNAPEVLITDLKDQRKSRSLIGRIGSLKFKADMPLNQAFSDRLAARLKTNGFNIKKRKIQPVKKRISRILGKSEAQNLIAGNIFVFSFESQDPVTMNVTAKGIFDIEVYDSTGTVIYEKYFCLSVTTDIHEKPLSNAEYLVEELLNASIDTVFNDRGFTGSIGIEAAEYKKLKDFAYYDKNLSGELNSLLLKYNLSEISRNEFQEKRDKMISSF